MVREGARPATMGKPIMITFEKPSQQFRVQWIDGGMSPSCPPDPAYPHGIQLNLSGGKSPACEAKLPHPAKGIGVFVITCQLCHLRVACTTAGRVDDPVSVLMPCKTQ